MSTTNVATDPCIGPAQKIEPHWVAGFYKLGEDPLEIRALDAIPGFYVEAQIHEPIHTTDIVDAMVFGPLDPELKEALQRADIGWEEVSP
jgi:hypothetical protein